MEFNEIITRGLSQSMARQDIPSNSKSIYGAKEEIMYCLSCSWSSVDFDRLRLHLFREHPTGAAIVANNSDETDLSVHDIKLFCIKEICHFSTTSCNVYEEHLMSCCLLLYENLSTIEKQRLKSTLKFILDFHNNHTMSAVSGFMEYISAINTMLICKNDEDQISKGMDHKILSSASSDPLSVLDASLCCGNNETNLERPVSAFPTPVLLFTTQNTDLNTTPGKMSTDDTSLSVGETSLLSVTEQGRNIFDEQMTNSDTSITFVSTSKEKTTLVHSGYSRNGSENVDLEIDVPGSPIDVRSVKNESNGDIIKEEVNTNYGDGRQTDLLPSIKCSGKIARMNTETQVVDSTDDLFKKDIKLFQHSGMHTGETSIPCNDSEETLTDKKPFRCDVCGKIFGRNNSYVIHMKVRTGKKTFKCNECGKTLVQISDLIKNMRTDRDKRKVKCNKCDRSFGHQSYLNRHMRTHTRERPFKCNECDKTFGDNSYLINHMGIHGGEKPFKCCECGKRYARNSCLLRHKRTHRGEKPFNCTKCGKKFAQNVSLIKHARTHTGEKPLKCKECGKTFGDYSNFLRHQKTHTGEKPFKCNDCDKTFGDKSNFIRHQKSHTGEKPFKCNECDKRFVQNIGLIRHMRIHNGEKPFKCTKCGKSFGQNSSLTKHSKTHSGEKSFRCDECHITFFEKTNFLSHQKTYHHISTSVTLVRV